MFLFSLLCGILRGRLLAKLLLCSHKTPNDDTLHESKRALIEPIFIFETVNALVPLELMPCCLHAFWTVCFSTFGIPMAIPCLRHVIHDIPR